MQNQLEKKILFIGGLDPEITASRLTYYLETIAPISDLNLIMTSRKNLSKGYAFFCAKNLENEYLFYEREIVIEGRNLFTRIKQPRKIYIKSKKMRIFVNGLPLGEFNDANLAKLFERFGPIKSAYAIRDHLSRSKGFGFVDFYYESSIYLAISNQQILQLYNKQLSVSEFQEKDYIVRNSWFSHREQFNALLERYKCDRPSFAKPINKSQKLNEDFSNYYFKWQTIKDFQNSFKIT